MIKHNPENERIKHCYFKYLREAKRYSGPTIDGIAQALTRFEQHSRYQSFKKFHIEKAISFKNKLAITPNAKTGKLLSKSTCQTILNALKNFFIWLAGQPGYRSKLSYSDPEYFNLSEKDSRAAKSHTNRPVPTMEQIRHVLNNMSSDTDINKRDRALIAFTILTGARDGATITLKLKHIDLKNRTVDFDSREVSTKFSKSFTTWFFPIGEDIEAIFTNWVKHIRSDLLFGPEDPLFPSTQVEHEQGQGFKVVGITRNPWRTTSPTRKIFKMAFAKARLPYANPHSFRNTLAQLGEQICRTPEEFKAWSQNFGHEKVMTTFSSYGAVQPQRQAEIITNLGRHKDDKTDEETLKKIAELLKPNKS